MAQKFANCFWNEEQVRLVVQYGVGNLTIIFVVREFFVVLDISVVFNLPDHELREE